MRWVTFLAILVLALSTLAFSLAPDFPFEVHVYNVERDGWSPTLMADMDQTVTTAVFCNHPLHNERLVATWAEEGYMAFIDLLTEYQNKDLCEWARYESINITNRVSEMDVVVQPDEFNELEEATTVPISIIVAHISNESDFLTISSIFEDTLYFAMLSRDWYQ